MPKPKSATKPGRTQAAPRRAGPEGILFYLLSAVVVVGAVWIVYGRALESPFIYDDKMSVRENPSIARLWPLVGTAALPGPLNPPKELPTSGRPLVNLTLAVNYHFGRLDPLGYHVFNMIVHALSALLLLAIVRRTLALEYFKGEYEPMAGWLALAVALIWALHPLQTETVIYVTQRTELMVGFFYLATLYGSLRYWAAATSSSRAGWLILSTLACLAGMASKEVMVTAPVIVLLFERTFIAKSFREAIQKSWPLYLGLGLGWVLLLGLNVGAPRSNTAGFHLPVPAYVWWLTQCEVLWIYLKLVIWPWPLAIHYELPYLTTISTAGPWLLLTALLGIGTLVLLWRKSPFGFVGAWVLVILSPTLIVPIVTEVAVERRMYLPLAALAALAVVGAYALAQRMLGERAEIDRRKSSARRLQLIVTAAAFVLALGLGMLSARRLEAYYDQLTLWQDVLKSQPNNATAHYNIGLSLNNLGQTQKAIDHYEQALQIRPMYADAHINLGNILAQAGHLPEAIEHFELAIQIAPNDAKSHNNLANALKDANRLPEAIEHYQRAVELKPDSPDIQNNLGLALVLAGKTDEAIDHYQIAARLNPESAQTYANMAAAYASGNQREEAITAGEKAVKLARAKGQIALAEQTEGWLTKYRAAAAQQREAAPKSQATPATP